MNKNLILQTDIISKYAFIFLLSCWSEIDIDKNIHDFHVLTFKVVPMNCLDKC